MSTMLWKLLREENPEYWQCRGTPRAPHSGEKLVLQGDRPATPDDLRSQIPYVRLSSEALRLPLLEVPGFEAAT